MNPESSIFTLAEQEGKDIMTSQSQPIVASNGQPKAEPAANWQPIASAPRDGTRVDLWAVFETGGRRVTATYYDGEIGEWWVSDHYHTGQYVHRPEITHWRPLPSPPVEAAGPSAASDEVPGKLKS